MDELIARKGYLAQLAMWREKQMIKVVAGVRRCGKSTLFELYIAALKASGITDEQIISINLEDEDYAELLDHKALYNYVKSHFVEGKWMYVFIDEVQNCPDYEKAVSSLFLKPQVDIYLTGSNAYMLSGELATKLSARYVAIDMLPLSFLEYGEAVAVPDKRERFNLYLNMGAFPYATRFVDNSLAHSQYLEGVYNTVLIKDVMVRKNLSDVTLLKTIVNFLAANVGSPVSAKKIADTMTSSGRPTAVATVEMCLAALTDSYLFYKVQRYDIKGKAHLRSLSKYYICDTGLRNMILGTRGTDIGHQIENMVYLELLRRGYTVNIGKSGRDTEVDFVAVRQSQPEYYQVSASVLDETTLARELAPLNQIRDNYPKHLLTLDDFTLDHNGIRQTNLIDWLLQDS
ncbi:MAG: ATP-binding protein [Propionibacteriaceae bacterium]|jgi:predicted AAA+ superfamily ATPase|nr:ATP-binding protein [Propionibacteriaceae bacterium]